MTRTGGGNSGYELVGCHSTFSGSFTQFALACACCTTLTEVQVPHCMGHAVTELCALTSVTIAVKMVKVAKILIKF